MDEGLSSVCYERAEILGIGGRGGFCSQSSIWFFDFKNRMLEGLKASNSPLERIGDKVWRWIKASLCVVLLVSVAIVSYSAFSSAADQYRWRCPLCNSKPAARPPLARRNGSDSVPTNISHIVFGIGGSAQTWQRRRGYSELWWRSGEMRGHVWLDKEPEEHWPDACPPYRVSTGNTSRFGVRADASRIARIAAEAYGLGLDGVRWFVMGDDDTVFFPENLVALLGRYDHEEMWYIGGVSESVEQDVMHSYGMAFGGGGFAISLPAAAALAGAIDGCLDRYARFYGSDQRVQACFSELGVPLTREPGFHQVDLRGDAYGMLAAHPVAPVVSLHHLDYVKPISPRGATQLDALRSLVGASRYDPARALQQAFCYVTEPELNWSVSVSWGYTVQVYPWVLAPKDMEVPLQTFQTWRSWSGGPFTFNTRPLAGPDRPCDRPMLFFLDGVRERKKGPEEPTTTLTEYKPADEKGRAVCDLPGFAAALRTETVRVFASRMDSDVWRRAPRRQCCDARRTGWLMRRSIEISVRDCYPGEITSPP